VTVRLLDLIAKQVQTRAGMTKILDRVFAENRSLTLSEEIEFDSMAAQLRELDGELENRRAVERRLHDHVITLLKNGHAQ
jgi:hypothetical protein